MRTRLISFFTLVLLAGCTNSPTVLKVLYGQFDNFMANELLGYANFTDAQEQAIRAAVEKTVTWHRYEALPGYVELLEQAQARLIDKEATEDDITWLYENSLDLARDFETQSPVLAIRPTIAKLSTEQVTQIKEKINDEFLKEQREMDQQAKRNQAQLSTENLTKFFKRIGLKLNKDQQLRATSYFAKRKISEQQRMPLWRQWADELIEIIENRGSDSFNDDFAEHYTSRFTLVERTFGEDWEHDQQLNKAMLLDIFISLSKGQRQAVRERWATLSTVAIELATK